MDGKRTEQKFLAQCRKVKEIFTVVLSFMQALTRHLWSLSLLPSLFHCSETRQLLVKPLSALTPSLPFDSCHLPAKQETRNLV